MEIPETAEDRAGKSLDLRPVRVLLERIIARWNPEEIYLFGSRARGSATAESDWDLLVIVPNETPEADFHPMVVYETRKDTRVAADVVLVTRDEFEEDRTVTNTLQYEAAHFGVRVYER